MLAFWRGGVLRSPPPKDPEPKDSVRLFCLPAAPLTLLARGGAANERTAEPARRSSACVTFLPGPRRRISSFTAVFAAPLAPRPYFAPWPIRQVLFAVPGLLLRRMNERSRIRFSGRLGTADLLHLSYSSAGSVWVTGS